MKTFIRSALFLLAILSAQAQVDQAQGLARLFDYDAKAALDIQEKASFDWNGVKVIDLTYASPKGGRVLAFLVLPNGKGPFAGVAFGHWGGGTRTEVLPEAELYAQVAAVSVMVDYP